MNQNTSQIIKILLGIIKHNYFTIIISIFPHFRVIFKFKSLSFFNGFMLVTLSFLTFDSFLEAGSFFWVFY